MKTRSNPIILLKPDDLNDFFCTAYKQEPQYDEKFDHTISTLPIVNSLHLSPITVEEICTVTMHYLTHMVSAQTVLHLISLK